MRSFQINFNDFSREPKELLNRQKFAIDEVINSGWYVLGKKVEEFESSWAEYTKSIGCVGVANGLDAIEIGLRVLNIGYGDEVITTSLTAFATTLAIIKAGAKPIFADIDLSTGSIDVNSIKKLITKNTKAIVAVHIYGRSCNLNQLDHLCKKNNLFLIEDCAQAHGAKYQGKSLGNFGIFGAWSFYPTKNLGALGDAGAITCNDKNILEKAKYLRNYGQTFRYKHDFLGSNSRLDELQAAVLIERLTYLHSWTESRRIIANKYWSLIKNKKITLLEQPEDEETHVNHLYVILIKDRDQFLSYLKDKGINTLIHYPIPNHKQKVFENINFDSLRLNNVEKFCNECISLPISPHLKDQEIDYVIKVCNEY